MPEFTPTPYMLETFADKEKQGGPWTIFAHCIRDLICKQSGIQPIDEKLKLKDKLAYIDLMNGAVDRAEINGQLFEYKGNEPV